MRTLSEKNSKKKLNFYGILVALVWLKGKIYGWWGRERRVVEEERSFFSFSCLLEIWNDILGGVHDMIWPTNDKSKGWGL